MMTSGRDGLEETARVNVTLQQSHASPGFIFIQAIETMTGRNAGLATRTGVQVNREGILLAFGWTAGRKQIPVYQRLQIERLRFVTLGEAFDRRQSLLF